jgi:adenosylhomocysteine nucleosidase
LDFSRLGVVVGLATEARIACRLDCRVAIGGGTPAGAQRATRQLVETGATGLISFGLAGGLDPALRPGDIVVPTAVTTDHGHFDTDRDLSHWLGGTTRHTLFGGTAIVVGAADKERLWQAAGASAVDLESAAVASIAAAHGLPFAVLRAICDPAERTLPAAALVALNQHGMIGVTRVLTSLLSHPLQIGALLALAADAAKAKQALNRRVATVRQA